MTIEIRHIFAEGRVQGVGYRDFVCRRARRLGVGGWVRNRADGTVEARAIGTGDAVEALLTEMRRGPPQSLVTQLRVADAIAGDDDTARPFVILPTL